MEKASRRFIKDASKEYTRKFRLYPSFAYKRLDKWLNKMSLSGWHLVDSNLVSFLFEYGTPQNKVYFTYDAGWGLNDAGKTNLLPALRFVFDRDTRRNDFIDSDYFEKKTDTPIEILVTVDISDNGSVAKF